MPIGDLLAQISGDAQSSLPSSSQSAKRKADNELVHNVDKAARTERAVANSSRPVQQIERPQQLGASALKMKPRVPPAAPRPANIVGASSYTGSHPATTATFDPAKPPKKGSYAEIMARGKAAQANLGQVGKISHKPVEKAMSKRERQEMVEQQKIVESLKKGGSKALRDGRNGIKENNGKSSKPIRSEPSAAEQKIKKAAAATTGYTGTARPNPASANRAKPHSTQQSRSSSVPNKQSSATPNRYTYASDDDEEDEEEDEEDYLSDASSDMEAAVFEVDEEEERAARIARKEDSDALKEENRLKREKEEKRQKLAAMAKSRQKH